MIASAFSAVVARDVRLALRQSVDSLMSVAFFIVASALFPLAVGPEPAVLERIAPGILWVTALLSTMASLDRLFLSDYQDGSLELTILSPLPLSLHAVAKALAHWLTSGVPLIVAAPAAALILGLSKESLGSLLLALLLGTPTLSLIGAVGAALSLGARRSGILVALLVIPLDMPVLVFGVSAVETSIGSGSSTAALTILAALLPASLALAPWATAAALRHAVE